jgi:hypothetical protein
MASSVASQPQEDASSLHRDLTKKKLVGSHGMRVEEREDVAEEKELCADLQHDPVFLEQARLARYRPTPLLVPFPPLDKTARAQLGPIELPATGWHTERGSGREPTPPSSPYGQSGMVRSGSPRTHNAETPYGTKSMGGLDLHSRDGGTLLPRGSLTARPGATAFPTTGSSKTIEEFRVALPLDTVPRLSPRSTRVLRESAYGRSAWDRTDITHMRATTPEVRGKPAATHTSNLRPWAAADWKQWQSDPAARNQSPRSQRRLAAATAASQAFNEQKGAAKEKDEVDGAGPKPYLGSELTREWWKAHQTNIQPWKTGFARAKTPKRSEPEVWPAAGRGVMEGWYTPRVTTPERLAREQARQARVLQDAMEHMHDANAAQNAEDAEDALESLDDAESAVAEGSASGLGPAAIAFSKALGYSSDGDGVLQRIETQKARVLMQLTAQLAPFAPPPPGSQASLSSVQAAKDAPVPQYELMLERYKFMQKLGSKGSGLPEEIVAQIKVCSRKAPKVGDALVAVKSTVNQSQPPQGTLSQTMDDLENGIAAYKLFLFFKPRDRKIHGKLKRAQATLRTRYVPPPLLCLRLSSALLTKSSHTHEASGFMSTHEHP